MIIAFLRAVGDAGAPPLRRVMAIGFALAVATYAVLWLVLAFALDRLTVFALPWLDWLAKMLGALGVLVLSWLLFPAVMTLIMGFFLDRVAAAVEARDYPGRPPPRHQRIAATIATTLRLMGLTLLLNLLALPVYLLVPGINLLVFLGLNGYLLGREYFEVVALRRLDELNSRAVRRRFGGQVFVAGVAIAGLFAVPLVNLVAPVIATAFMVHVFEGLPRVDPHAAGA